MGQKVISMSSLAKQLDHIYAGEKRWFENDSKSFYDSERTKKLVISLENNQIIFGIEKNVVCKQLFNNHASKMDYQQLDTSTAEKKNVVRES